MKYVLVLGLTLVVLWLWRSGRQAEAGDNKSTHPRQRQASLEQATEIVACQLCRVHLPKNDTLIGRHGLYCSAEHRQLAGD
jgi:uncharacterized protein